MSLDEPDTTLLMADAPAEAFRALIRVYGQLGRIMQPYFASFGITGSQWGVLRTLHGTEEEGLSAVRMTDLSERLLIRPPSITGTVDRLVRMGLVARIPSPRDQRSKQVSLTPAGQQLVQRVLENHSRKVSELLGGLSLDEQAQLQQLLHRLGTHLEGMAVGEPRG